MQPKNKISNNNKSQKPLEGFFTQGQMPNWKTILDI